MFSLNIIKKNKGGFTLLEVMVAIFIFAIIMVGTSSIFASSISSYRNAKAIQRDLENAQYAMNLMAKTIRTSTVSSSSSSQIDIYDYSQSKCVRYALSGNMIKTGSYSSSDPDPICSASASGNLSDFYVDSANFSVIQSSPGIVGKVTISMKICPPAGCGGREKDTVQIQSSVSLRDYGKAEL